MYMIWEPLGGQFIRLAAFKVTLTVYVICLLASPDKISL